MIQQDLRRISMGAGDGNPSKIREVSLDRFSLNPAHPDKTTNTHGMETRYLYDRQTRY